MWRAKGIFFQTDIPHNPGNYLNGVKQSCMEHILALPIQLNQGAVIWQNRCDK